MIHTAHVLRFALTASLALVFNAPPLFAEEDPGEWLRRMGDAVENLNYSGTLVHINNGMAGVLQIVHRVEDGRVSERITSLDGMAREIIRNDDEVTCILPDQQAVLVERRDDRDPETSPLRGRLPTATGFNDSHYRLESSGLERAAGRLARIIDIKPLDRFRYGYRLWLDIDTAMPLKSQLRDDSGNVIEEILFANIYIPESISPALLRPSLTTENYVWHRSGERPEGEDGGEVNGSEWRALELPDGFQLIAALSKMPPGARQPMEHLVYADGVASVSVFIEAGVAASEQAEGLSMVGAANAYTTTLDGQLITAMGEVPARTVEMIALSMRPNGGT